MNTIKRIYAEIKEDIKYGNRDYYEGTNIWGKLVGTILYPLNLGVIIIQAIQSVNQKLDREKKEKYLEDYIKQPKSSEYIQCLQDTSFIKSEIIQYREVYFTQNDQAYQIYHNGECFFLLHYQLDPITQEVIGGDTYEIRSNSLESIRDYIFQDKIRNDKINSLLQ